MADYISGKDALDALKSGSMKIPKRAVGFIKPGSKDEFIAFAPNQDCERWVDLPVEVVERVELLGESGCGEHTHLVARLYFRASDDPREIALTSILAQSTRHPKRESLSGAETLRAPGGSGCSKLMEACLNGSVAACQTYWDSCQGAPMEPGPEHDTTIDTCFQDCRIEARRYPPGARRDRFLRDCIAGCKASYG